jgi:DNA-binding CsgD family transcriptional regulator
VDTRELTRRAAELSLQGLELDEACLAFDGLLRRAVPYLVAAWSTQDPATGLFTSCTVSGMPKDLEREAAIFRYEYRDDEPSTFGRLIAEDRTVAILSEVTSGRLDRAARYRELLRGFGCTDELRTVLWVDGQPWGSAILYRAEGRFTAADAAQVAALAPHAARGLRLVMLRAAATRPEAVTDPPGILQVAPGGRVTALTAPADRWLTFGGDALVTAANAVAAAVRGNPDWQGASSRLALPGGSLLSLHAARTTEDDAEVAVIVDAARPAQVAAMLVDAYGLTARQREVLGGLLLGRTPARLARELGVSEHTINDHRKAIYQRLGVSSRSELAARLQAEQYDPRTHAGQHPSPYGGYLADHHLADHHLADHHLADHHPPPTTTS